MAKADSYRECTDVGVALATRSANRQIKDAVILSPFPKRPVICNLKKDKMTILKWNNKLSVNIDEIDEQHKHLILMVNELNEAMHEQKEKDVLGKIIDGLINFSATHFATEEKYFDRYSYPATEAHKKEHVTFVKKIIIFKLGVDEDRIMLSLEVMNFLQEWLMNHLQVSDKKYGIYLTEKGVA